MLVHSSRLLVNSIRLLLLRQESDRSLLWGAICLKIKRIFIYSARNIQIQCRIYISSQGFIYPPQDIYIQSGICISTTGYIYPVRDIYILHGIYHLWSQNIVMCYPRPCVCDHVTCCSTATHWLIAATRHVITRTRPGNTWLYSVTINGKWCAGYINPWLDHSQAFPGCTFDCLQYVIVKWSQERPVKEHT